MNVEMSQWTVAEINGKSYLYGRVWNHPDHVNGKLVISTEIKQYYPDSLIVQTKSGRMYYLSENSNEGDMARLRKFQVGVS